MCRPKYTGNTEKAAISYWTPKVSHNLVIYRNAMKKIENKCKSSRYLILAVIVNGS